MREQFYDNAKGIGIILLIMGHVYPYGSIPFNMIFTFHMPLFFIISGMLLNNSRRRDYYGITKKTLISYSFFLLLGIFCLFVRILIGDFSPYGGARNFVVECFYNIGPDSGMVGSIWFLPILGVSQIIALYLYNVRNKTKKHGIALDVCFLGLLVLLSNYALSYLPGCLRLKSIFTATLFVYIGLNWSEEIKDIVLNAKYKLGQLIIVIPIWAYLALQNKTVNIAVPVYNNYAIFIICAFLGIYIVFLLSKFTYGELFSFWGRNSLIIFATHGIWLYLFSMMENPQSEIVKQCCLMGKSALIALLSVPTFYFFKPILKSYQTKLQNLLR